MEENVFLDKLHWSIQESARQARCSTGRPALNNRHRYDANAHLFTFIEMADIVKSRFSKAGAEEFSNMLYRLASKHGYLDEVTSRAIDGIVPAIIEREKGATTIQIPTAHQVNINPHQVTNNFSDEEKK